MGLGLGKAQQDKAPKRGKRTQIGALCYREGGNGLEVLLITSRRTRRWIGPKGWPIKKKKPWEVAVIEAAEEAGVTGRVQHQRIGHFDYVKDLGSGRSVVCRVAVYPLCQDGPTRRLRRRCSGPRGAKPGFGPFAV